MKLMLHHEPTKVLCVGMSGCGKTLWANQFILRSRYLYYFIFDHDGQFAQRNKLKAALTAPQMLAQLKRERFVLFNPTEMFSDITAGFDWFCSYAYAMSERLPGTKLIFCDELQDLTGVNRIPENVRKVLVSGRNRGLDFLACTLQYNMLHNSIRGQATVTVAFKTEEDLALKALVERGFRADEIAALKPGEYVQRNARTGQEVRSKIVFASAGKSA